MGCNLSFAKAEWWALLSKYTPPAFSIFDMGVTQASRSFKNDFKISQSSAEFETQGRHSIIKHMGGGEGKGEGLARRSNSRTQNIYPKIAILKSTKIIPPKYSQGTVQKLKD